MRKTEVVDRRPLAFGGLCNSRCPCTFTLFKDYSLKVCVAQIAPVKGNVHFNIERHKKLIDLAVSIEADLVIFPELSITGYEPLLAKELATEKDDSRFDVFQQISDGKKITIGIGMPLKSQEGISIGMIIFQPQQPRQVYLKEYIHSDEEPFFVCGKNSSNILPAMQEKIALAICYEISIPQHTATAVENGATIYIASVAKSVTGAANAIETLSATAKNYSMTVLMSNCIGYCDNFESGGRTSIWNSDGILVAQLDDKTEGVLTIDTKTQIVGKKYIESTVSTTL